MLVDCSIFVEPNSLSFALDLSICTSELVGLRSGSLRCNSSVAVFPSAYHHPGGSLFRCCGRNLIFNSATATISYNMSLKNWSNYSLSWNRCIDSGSLISTRKCVFSACWCSFSKTIVYVRKSFGAHPNGDSSRECRIFTNSRKLEIFLQCFKSLKTFSQSVSRCPMTGSLEFAPKNSLLAVSLFSHPSSSSTSSNCLSHKRPASGCPYKFRSTRTTGFLMSDHEFGHLRRGRRIHTSWKF